MPGHHKSSGNISAGVDYDKQTYSEDTRAPGVHSLCLAEVKGAVSIFNHTADVAGGMFKG